MTLRLAAAATLLLGVAALLLELHLVGRGPFASAEARHLRRLKDRTSPSAATAPVALAAFAGLPRGRKPDARSALENRGVVVEGYVQRMFRALDGDLHLDLVEVSPGESGPLRPYVVAEVTTAWRRAHPGVDFERLASYLRPRLGGATPWEGGPARVRLTGWLFYDEVHEQRPPRARYPEALAAWEVHPVSGIEVWEPRQQAYVELRR